MRSDIPKVLHTLAGRSMLSHALHSVAKVAPQHLVVVLGHDRERITPAVTELAETLGRPIDIAVQDQQLGTGHAVGCGLAALPADFAGTVVVDLRRRPAAGRRHPGRPDRHPQLRDRRGDGDDDDAARPDGLRPRSCAPRTARSSASSKRSTPPGRSGPSARSTPACTPSTSTVLRSALSRLRPHNAQQELYLTDVISIIRQDGRIVRAKHVDDAALVAGINDRVQLAELAAELNRRIVAAHQRAGVTVVDPAITWIDVDVSVGRDTVDPARHPAAGRHPHRRPLRDRPGHHA